LIRIYAVERKMAEEREAAREQQSQPTGPPMRDTGRDTADDDDE